MAAALLATALLLLGPSYFGHMFNNPKDIPFAVGGCAECFELLAACPRRSWTGSSLPSLSFIGVPEVPFFTGQKGFPDKLDPYQLTRVMKWENSRPKPGTPG